MNCSFKSLLTAAIILLSLCQSSVAQDIIPFSSNWEYLHPQDGENPGFADPNNDFGATWHTPAEYDGPAFSAPAPAVLGYDLSGERSPETNITAPPEGQRHTAYFRTTITTTQDYQDLEFVVNDGGVLYLNGEAVAWINYRVGQDRHEGRAIEPNDELAVVKVRLPVLVEAGEHDVAFSLHNHSPDSNTKH